MFSSRPRWCAYEDVCSQHAQVGEWHALYCGLGSKYGSVEPKIQVSAWLNNDGCHCSAAAFQAKVQWCWEDQDHREHIHGSHGSECCAQPGARPGRCTHVNCLRMLVSPPVAKPAMQGPRTLPVYWPKLNVHSPKRIKKKKELWKLLRVLWFWEDKTINGWLIPGK